jgi:GWxTD domain-containing protein
MRVLETWVSSPLAVAVGWTLLHSLWEGAVIAAALAAVLVVVRSPRFRYAAACVAMLVLLAVCGVTLIRVMPASFAGPALKPHAFPGWNVPAGGDSGSPWKPDLAATVPWLAPLWVVGVLIFCLWHVAGWISVSRLRRRGVCCASERWQKELVRLSEQLRLSRPVVLLESCLVDAPMVLGHFRPFILMPVGLLTGLPAGQIEAILLHELAHIRRLDYLVNWLQRSMEGLLFYHPAVWWISRVIRVEREHCCDDLVVAIRGNAHEYAVALAGLERSRWSGREPVAVAATGGNLVKRIRRLLYPRGPNGAWAPLLAAAILIATATVTLAAWQASPAQPDSTGQPKTSLADPTGHERWLNQDVVYIIANQERDAFVKLTTAAERDKFVEQFWERRNPTPGSAENEYKKEHYRRLAYANEHFASSRQGWQTDRGHMYIVYGPPDEIEGHPKDAQRPSAWEIWMYWHVEGIGDNLTVTFIDRTGTGDYRLAPGNGQ